MRFNEIFVKAFGIKKRTVCTVTMSIVALALLTGSAGCKTSSSDDIFGSSGKTQTGANGSGRSGGVSGTDKTPSGSALDAAAETTAVSSGEVGDSAEAGQNNQGNGQNTGAGNDQPGGGGDYVPEPGLIAAPPQGEEKPAFTDTDGTTLVVSGTEAFRRALENPAGSTIKLGNDIVFTILTAYDYEYGANITDGNHYIDLNGFTMQYSYVDNYGNTSGSVINVQSGNLTINGDGNCIGGRFAFDNSGQWSTTVINGGNYRGVEGNGMRLRQGAAIINAGTFSGPFGGAFLEDGCIVDIAGSISRYDRRGGSYIRDGVLHGNCNLTVPLTLGILSIPAGASINITGGAVLNITGAISGKEAINVQEGMLVADGEGTVAGRAELRESIVMNKLTVQTGGFLIIRQGIKLTVTGNAVNSGVIDIMSNAVFDVKGTLTDNGTINKPMSPPTQGSMLPQSPMAPGPPTQAPLTQMPLPTPVPTIPPTPPT